jgi:hypothetical protein
MTRTSDAIGAFAFIGPAPPAHPARMIVRPIASPPIPSIGLFNPPTDTR